jgi:hypothetical protein
MRCVVKIFFCLWAVQAFAAFNLTWGTPAIGLDSNPPIGDTDSNATIAIDPLGNAVASWSRTTGRAATENVWAAVYNHSLRVWTGAVKISGGGSADNSQVAIDEWGNAILVWEEGFPTQICYRTLSSGGVWTPDLTMPPETVSESINAQTFPQISVDSQGNAVAIWTEFFGKKNHVFSAKKPLGLPWVALGEISSGARNATLIPSKALSINQAGNGIAVWQESNGNLSVHGALYIDGKWMAPLVIANDPTKSAQTPSAGIDAAGNAVIVWAQENKIFSKTLINGVLSMTPLLVSNPAYDSLRPHVGVDAAGNAVVVYERYNAMHKFITGSSLPKGASVWKTPVDVSAPSPSDAAAAGYPVFCMNSIGDGVAIWKESTGTNMVIQGAGYSLGTWSFIKTLSSLSGDSGSPLPAYDIAVVLNEAGNILAIWPEDPHGAGPQQIKTTAGVGLANTGPLPPVPDPVTVLSGIVTGVQVVHRFPAHADLINILSWTSPGGVAYFKVYRGSLSSLVATTTDPRYEDHQRIPKQKETYLITSVDHYGQESGPMTIVVTPL